MLGFLWKMASSNNIFAIKLAHNMRFMNTITPILMDAEEHTKEESTKMLHQVARLFALLSKVGEIQRIEDIMKGEFSKTPEK